MYVHPKVCKSAPGKETSIFHCFQRFNCTKTCEIIFILSPIGQELVGSPHTTEFDQTILEKGLGTIITFSAHFSRTFLLQGFRIGTTKHLWYICHSANLYYVLHVFRSNILDKAIEQLSNAIFTRCHQTYLPYRPPHDQTTMKFSTYSIERTWQGLSTPDRTIYRPPTRRAADEHCNITICWVM